ncbi:MAG TPA: S-layer homology domain-containing protein, partial [Bacillota bacterium]|nr:S-layer homology domain-containing protein [Bacillota bacterium]
MRKIFILIALCLIFVMRMAPASVFADYEGASSWAVPELDKAAGCGLITDRVMDDVSRNVTREEFAEIVVRMYELFTGKEAEAGDVSFTDTANKEIHKAANMGLVLGVGDGKFAPGNLVTREQMAVILLRTLKTMNPAADFST